jgi:hypothetical protein
VEIVAALFVESIDFRTVPAVPNPSTRIDLTGVFFSLPVAGFPTTIEPHLVVLVRVAPDHHGTGALVVSYRRDGEEIARNRQVFSVDPGKFGYRLVRGELTFDEPGSVEAHCTIDGSDTTIVVPLAVVPRE